MEKKTCIMQVEVNAFGAVRVTILKQMVDEGRILLEEPHQMVIPFDANLANLETMGYPTGSPNGMSTDTVRGVVTLIRGAEEVKAAASQQLLAGAEQDAGEASSPVG